MIAQKSGEVPESLAASGLHLSDPDFTTPEWRAKLMDWAVEQELFKEFVYWTQDRVEKIELAAIYVYLWRNLATLIVEYHGEGR